MLTGDLTVASGTLNLEGSNISRATPGGTLIVSNAASLLVGGANNFPAGFTAYALDANSTVEYTGTDQAVANMLYGNLHLRGSGTKTLPATAMTIAGNFSMSGTATAVAQASLSIGRHVGITTGATFDAGSFTHPVGGQWFVDGTFLQGTSTIEFTGTEAVSIGATNFHNVTFSGPGVKTAAGNLTVSGSFHIANNFDAGSYIHTINGDWTNSGSFTAGTSTVVFSGSTPQAIGGTAASSFNNVTVANAAGVALAQNSTIGGTLIFAAGGIDVGAGFTATVQHLDAGTYQLAGDGSYVLPAGGSITTANTNGVDGGTIAVSGARTYAATGASFTFKAATVNPFPAAVTGVNNLTLEAGVTLNKSIDVAGTVALTSGLLTVPAGRELSLAGANAIAGAPFGTAKHIVTAVDPTDGTKGFVRVNGITAAYTFPVGNGTHYLPVSLTPQAATSNDFAVCVFPGLTANGEPNGTPFTEAQKQGAVDAVWMVNRQAGSGAVDMTVSWPSALEGLYFQGLSDASIGIAHYGSAWEVAMGTGDNTANTVTRTGITDFSPFGVGEVLVILPVKFTSFTATRQGEAVDLQWTTAQEENNRGFTVQRRTDGVWQNIAVVPTKAPGGNSSQPLAYAYKDLNTYGGISQYRILQTDIDGKYSYSDVRAVRGIRQAAAVVAYPNPSAGGTVNLLLGAATQSEARVLDGQGRLVREYRHVGSNHLVIDRLGSGLYTVQVTDRSSGEVSVVRVLVQ